MALLSRRQPRSEAEAKDWREAGYLSTMRSRCRFFCLSWLFLPACNLRLICPLSSWVLRAPVERGAQSPAWFHWVRAGPGASGWITRLLLQIVRSESSRSNKDSGHDQGWAPWAGQGTVLGLGPEERRAQADPTALQNTHTLQRATGRLEGKQKPSGWGHWHKFRGAR